MKVVFHHNHETLFQLKPLKPGFVVDRTPQSQNLIWSGHCRVNYKKKKLCGKQYTWETFLYPSQRHSRVRLCVVSHHTTVIRVHHIFEMEIVYWPVVRKN